MVEANPGEVPTGRIALSLIIGFVLMLIIEQLISPNAHALGDMPMTLQSKATSSTLTSAVSVEFDAELGDFEQGAGHPMDRHNSVSAAGNSGDAGIGRERAFTLLLGLVFHGCADGLALGVANLAKTTPGATNTVSVVVFLALILHKGLNVAKFHLIQQLTSVLAPTSLAFTTSILSTSLPRPDCKKYLAIFSLSTPLMAILSYFSFFFFGDGDQTNFIGIALLISVSCYLLTLFQWHFLNSHDTPHRAGHSST